MPLVSLYDRGRGKFETHREGNVKMEAEIRVMWLQATECQQTPETGKGNEQILSQSLQREYDPDTVILDFWSQELLRINLF